MVLFGFRFWYFFCVTCWFCFFFFFFSSRRRHTRCREVSWARRCVQETAPNPILKNNQIMYINCLKLYFSSIYINTLLFDWIYPYYQLLIILTLFEHYQQPLLRLLVELKSQLFYQSHHCQNSCLLYTSDAADDTPCVDLGGRRIIKKKKTKNSS
eukprot:TRINITY_DN30588_c0_g1_i4.p2 TRINITY_DN30588_c0_g1~~TRINITY_DN30588_c0_g1_i4.p2  ORF type:complete len:155 (-),score=34.56 TRINITY_DN30588_c0_g1_i4:95-559(-)